MDDAGLLRVLELILDDRFKSIKAGAQTDNAMQHAAEFGRALAYVRERRKAADRPDSAFASFLG